MDSYALIAVLVFVLSACSVHLLLLAILHPRIEANSPFARRLALVAPTRVEKNVDTSYRKRSIEETLREADERARSKRSKPSLAVRLRQAQLNWSKTGFYLICLVVGLLVFFLVILAGLGRPPALGFGLSAGLLLPHWYVNFRRKRRFKRFLLQFANAIDVIVRGVKVGLPLVECVKSIASDGQSPLKDEFKIVVDDQVMGMPLAHATERLPERIPLPETRFFGIVIAMHSRSGGNLSEVLGNLSNLLRDRQKMQQKIRALSSEAKAS